MRLRLGALALLALLGGAALALAACVPASVLPSLPSQGGPAWRELESEHFLLWTDASSERARALIKSLEERHQILARGMNRAEQQSRIFAIVFRSAEELQFFLPPNLAAFAWSQDNPTYQPGVVMSAETWGPIINHELAHAISYALLESQPRWLAEALACYFEMGRVDPVSKEVTIGLPYPYRMGFLRDRRPMSTRELFACKSLRCATPKFYAWSWALFAFLLDQHFDRFAVYLRELRAEGGDHEAAWRAAFPELALDALDQDLLEWTYNGDLKVVRFKIEPRAVPAIERPLRDADVLAARSLLHFINGDREPSARAAAAAVSADPLHRLGWAMAHGNGLAISIERARQLTEAHPADWRSWQLLLHALRRAGAPPEELRPAAARMCELAAEQGLGCRGKVDAKVDADVARRGQPLLLRPPSTSSPAQSHTP